MAIRVLLCDLGGVLVDLSFGRAIDAWARSAGVGGDAIADKLVVDDAWADFEVNRITEPAYVDHLRQQLGVSLTNEEMIAGWNAVYIGVNDDVERLLKRIARNGTRVVGVTNTNVTHQTACTERFAAHMDVFSTVYSSCEMGCRKPDREFFQRVLNAEEVVPAEALFIDDSESNVTGAAAMGIRTVQYRDAANLRQAFAHLGVIDA